MKKFGIEYLFKNVVVAIGLILVWRGVWYGLDFLDKVIFGGSHVVTVIIGIILGFALMYLPERNLQTLERL